MSPPLRLLLITEIDVERQPNNREHHLLRHLPAAFDATTIVFKRRNAPGPFPVMLKEMLLPGARVFMRDGVRYVEVNTLLNHYPGMSRDLTRSQPQGEPGAPGQAPPPDGHPEGALVRARRALLGPISALGLVKDAALFGSLFSAALLRAGGRYDVCLGLGRWGGLVGWTLKKAGRVSCLVYVDRDYESAHIVSRLRRACLSRLERLAMRRADQVIAIGEGLAALRRRETGRDVAVVSTGVDTGRFAAGRDKVPHPPTLIYTGNLTWWSGVDLAIDALARIRRRVPGARLLVVGAGIASYEERLRALVRRLGLEESVVLLGARPNDALPALLREADVGLACFPPHPLRRFAVPLKVFEYMAAGVPSLVTRGTESAAIVERAGCGLAIDYDREALAEAGGRLLEDGALRGDLSRNAVRASAEFDWSILLERERRLIEAARRRVEAGRGTWGASSAW